MRTFVIGVGVVFFAAGCAATPPAPPSPRVGTPVSASFDKTWSAVIDVFAARNIPIKNMDKSSGFIATEEMSVPGSNARTQNPLADCGKTGIGTYWQPTNANYNVRVKPEGSGSSVQITVFWKSVLGSPAPTVNCTSTGKWESDAEAEIKARAEGR